MKSKVKQLTVKQVIKQQADVWVSQMNRGLTLIEKQNLTAWANQDIKHHQALYKSASFKDDITVLKELSGLFPLEKNSQKFSLLLYSFVLITCLVIFTLFFSSQVFNYSIFSSKSLASPQQALITKIGEQKTFTLKDGSLVTLNTNSHVDINYSDSHREITLLYGEAQFTVAKDKSRPFTVTSGEKSFTALGTIFNVQKGNQLDMELVVSEGSVLVTDAQQTLMNLTKTITKELNKPNSLQIVVGGEKSTIINKVQQKTLSLSSEQTDNELAWQKGMLIFNGETLLEVLSEVSRYTNVEFEIADDSLTKIKVAGYFKANDIEGMLSSLAYNFDINYQYHATNSVLLSIKK